MNQYILCLCKINIPYRMNCTLDSFLLYYYEHDASIIMFIRNNACELDVHKRSLFCSHGFIHMSISPQCETSKYPIGVLLGKN